MARRMGEHVHLFTGQDVFARSCEVSADDIDVDAINAGPPPGTFDSSWSHHLLNAVDRSNVTENGVVDDAVT